MMKYLSALWVAMRFLLLLFGTFLISDIAMTYLPHWIGVSVIILVGGLMGVLMLKLFQSAPQRF